MYLKYCETISKILHTGIFGSIGAGTQVFICCLGSRFSYVVGTLQRSVGYSTVGRYLPATEWLAAEAAAAALASLPWLPPHLTWEPLPRIRWSSIHATASWSRQKGGLFTSNPNKHFITGIFVADPHFFPRIRLRIRIHNVDNGSGSFHRSTNPDSQKS